MRQEQSDGGPADSKISPTVRVRRQLERLRKTWSLCQHNRDRDAIYKYLRAVFDLVSRWRSQGYAEGRARCVRLLLQKAGPLEVESFAIVIEATSNAKKVDRKMRSKWSRVLRFAEKHKSEGKSLKKFIKQRGGINACAALAARRLGRSRST
jgi:hypothetical protein